MLIVLQALTHKQLKTHWCVLSTVATDTLVLRHQAISIHSADQVFIVLDQLHTKILHFLWKTFEKWITSFKKCIICFRVKSSQWITQIAEVCKQQAFGQCICKPLINHGKWYGCLSILRFHYDVNTWKYFSHHWPFVRGIHQSVVDSPHKGTLM